MIAIRHFSAALIAGLLVSQGALAKDIKAVRYHDGGDVFFFEQATGGGDVVRFVPRSKTAVTYLSTVPTTGGGEAKLWRIQVSLDFTKVDAAKARARAAIPAWSGLTFVRDAVTTAGCRLLLSDPDVKLVTPPADGPYEVLADQVCDLEVATRSSRAEARLSQLAAERELVDTGIAPYRVVSGAERRIYLDSPHDKLEQAGDTLDGVSRDVALFMVGYAVADQLGDEVLSMDEEELAPILDALLEALFQQQGEAYSLRDSPASASIEVAGGRVIKEFSP